MRFSERMGYREQQSIQVESMDEDLRNSLYNVVVEYMVNDLENVYSTRVDRSKARFNDAWQIFFKQPLHESPASLSSRYNRAVNFLHPFFMESDWNRVYDFVEFLVEQSDGNLTTGFNEVLIREISGYRILESIVVPISDSTQLDEISASLEATKTSDLQGAHEHIANALKKLSDRDNPDYRNSIKESISAVESAVSVLTGATKPVLNDALKLLVENGQLHPALRASFSKLYGWTSDESGIRHALLEESNLDFSDAQFMLVSCSAFIHYLLVKLSENS